MSFAFTRQQHLKRQSDFLRTLKNGLRETRGPIVTHAARSPEGITKTRIGIRIGRRCGNAVLRNRIKRLLREAFRLTQHDWSAPFDLVITVQPHEPMELADYQAILAKVATKVVQRTIAREQRKSPGQT
ncbi:MAG: ribonuclease P protein component [Tepidisphaeraceae bacterium]